MLHRCRYLIGSLCLAILIAAPPPAAAQRSEADASAESKPDTSAGSEPDTSVAGNEAVAEIIRTFPGRGVQADDSEPTPPEQAVEQFQVRDGFEIELVASEPDIAQPLFVSWDSRGRMWVVQYLQYQFPAGLKVIRYDQHLRAVFDKVPDPPPAGVRGADKITVFEDTDGDGTYDAHRDVITGLNIATAVQVGRGGIWVLNPPYLLFYPDANGDDLPDGDPEVHLSGFGLQDTHSVANSLTWGPDGWLYGASGSTTTGTVSSEVTKGVEFQGQCIWRYHPDTKVFEIYAEGGGNTFSLDIDSKGRVFSGTNGGNTRGWYYPQGSYSEKRWGKHGPLTNPYAFGYFPPMDFEGDGRRFAQAFCIYEGGLFPPEFDGTIIAPNSLHNLIWHSERIPDGSTYRTVDNENLVESPDRWFRPVYSGVGPDGAVYIADWYDTRLSHVSPIDDWHKESGRIYRIEPEGTQPAYRQGDLSEFSPSELIERFADANEWVRRRAVLELGWRGDTSVTERLVEMVQRDGSLEALWAVHLLGELTTERAVKWLGHDDPHIRRWVVRLLGDRHEGHPELAAMAEREENVQVRSQLAATAKRIPAEHALPVIARLLERDEDLHDPHLPLMNWWALEAHAESWPQIEAMFSDPEIWQRPMVRQTITARLMQRYAAAGTLEDLERCARLLELAPDEASRRKLMIGLHRAFQGRSLPPLPDKLAAALEQFQSSLGDSGVVLGLRRGEDTAVSQAIKILLDSSHDLVLRLELARTLGEVHRQRAVPALIRLATAQATDEAALQRVAILALGQYTDERIPKALVGAFGGTISNEHGLRASACRTLASRPEWALALLEEINQWRLQPRDVPADVVQQLRTYEAPEIHDAVEQAFGPAPETSSPEKRQQMQRLQELLAGGLGDAGAGKALFAQRCGNCHQLFGEGEKVGPALDGYERGKLSFWIPAIIDPSLEIREGFQSYLALTDDGRAINGMIAAQDPQTVTLRNADNETTVLDRDQLEVLKALDTSLMPDDALKEMSDQQLRDLFAYLTLGARR